MEEEINFCPFCDASQHKIMLCSKCLYYCKECHRFFNFELVKLKCPVCGKDNFEKSDFSAPTGDVIFQCKSCKKMYPSSKFFKENDIS